MKRLSVPIRAIAVLPIKCYQLIVSPLLPRSCRFAPSCSHYAIEALQHHGVFRGGYLAVARLLRCHPWADWGFDPVPDSFTFRPWRKFSQPQCQGHHRSGSCHAKSPV
jgi:putative membrane protein insertion efficiency factor